MGVRRSIGVRFPGLDSNDPVDAVSLAAARLDEVRANGHVRLDAQDGVYQYRTRPIDASVGDIRHVGDRLPVAEAVQAWVVRFYDEDPRHAPDIPILSVWSAYVYAVRGGLVVGYAAVDDTHEGGVYDRLASVWVEPRWRGRGIGRQLIAEVATSFEVTHLERPISRDGRALLQAVAPWLLHPGQRQAAALGRNEPCPCGSGNKYKRCHGA